MGDTATKTKKAKKAKGTNPSDTAPVPATGEAVAQPEQTAVQTDMAPAKAPEKTPRLKKNATETVIDLNDPGSALKWLSEFYEQSSKQPARKGYDQHWNKNGFIHTGPAERLPNSGSANMVVFIGDVLAKREAEGDTNAGATLDYLINFLQNRRSTLATERKAAILAEADAILAEQSKVA